jgi:hypothetical protein
MESAHAMIADGIGVSGFCGVTVVVKYFAFNWNFSMILIGDCKKNLGIFIYDRGFAGESCPDCQENLFARIQLGEFDFPDEEWCRVSDDVKDLISHLLVCRISLSGGNGTGEGF